ncbi:hypothetical protein [Pacificoceanicola onchidii]|uniref:hypothetical protein n=1 Tax=Pacificoceanicola onchidii TaxID=2562685 RepID=UPI0014561B5F|nr:hypothetical protein [Pacificoceanicola onchidii]
MERKNTPPKNPQNAREDRLKAALKANLGRRKAQAKARAADGAGTADKSSGNKD